MMRTCEFLGVFVFFICHFCICWSKPELKLLQTVFRHGDRAADSLPKYYPNDPYGPDNWYPVPEGGLTNRGKVRSFELGKFFRQRYDRFLGTSKHPDVVSFFSSSADRAKLSGQLVAAGLYPPQPHEKWNINLNWHPMPMKSATSPQEGWWYYSSVGLCKNFQNLQKHAVDTEPYLIQYMKDHRGFYDDISRHAGANGTFELAYMLYVTITAEAEMGLPRPNWTHGLMPEGPLKDAAGEVFVIRGYTNDLKKIGGGIWLKMWLDNIETFIAGKMSKRRAFFWAGHDQNVGDLLVALQAFDEPHVPPYASAIILELYQEGARYFVKTLYKKDLYLEPLIIPGCNVILCPLETFKKILAPILPEDLAETCGNK